MVAFATQRGQGTKSTPPRIIEQHNQAGGFGCYFGTSWAARAARNPGFCYPSTEKSKKIVTGVEKISIRQGSAQKTKGPRRDPQNMQPGRRKSHAFGYRDFSVFIKNRWEFQSRSCFSQNSTKLAARTRVARTRSSDRTRVAGTRSRLTGNPGENVVRIY